MGCVCDDGVCDDGVCVMGLYEGEGGEGEYVCDDVV